jgi:hypothetical protein
MQTEKGVTLAQYSIIRASNVQKAEFLGQKCEDVKTVNYKLHLSCNCQEINRVRYWEFHDLVKAGSQSVARLI